jgi:uncharacterized protein
MYCMDSRHSDQAADRGGMPVTTKILIAGGFGVGKTTLVATISEIRPLRTEEELSDRSIGVDDTAGVERKTTTTVAMDFGRISFRSDLVLYLFGTPGQERFWFMWDELSYGALGAVILADTRRLADCFASIDYFERHQTPFVIAVNCFDGAPQYQVEDIRIALALDPGAPVILCDARQRDSVKRVLMTLVKHVLDQATTDEKHQESALPARLPGAASRHPAQTAVGAQAAAGQPVEQAAGPAPEPQPGAGDVELAGAAQLAHVQQRAGDHCGLATQFRVRRDQHAERAGHGGGGVAP